MKEALQELFIELKESYTNDSFVKLTLSKTVKKSDTLANVYIRKVIIKDEPCLQFLYRYLTNDQVKNYTLEESINELEILLTEKFKAATLFTLSNDLIVLISKKKKVSYKKTKPSLTKKPSENHDKSKERLASGKYLELLGVTDKQGNVIPKMADKYRQINKYLEIIEVQLKAVKLPKTIHIVDMGSGKGYLTFALYDYLVNKRNHKVTLTGIELRDSLVDYCNDVADKCGYSDLKFVAQPIQDYDNDKIDILIALHACDTATDDAIFKGLSAKSELIICAPCCHKQVRQQVKGKEQESPLLKYGIFKERHFEMITDTIRALIMEKHNYNTKVFEFISNEHTRKNVMLIGSKSNKKFDVDSLNKKIEELKTAYQIDEHYLESLF
ncbi:Methyltransferase domain-containing protein [Tenacibaculum sp. MAR_2009_124]|uniref:class I SAM-dependent methyltransferase n=1 Tax=Tenacibaculum sp. MAR_2009_124 TaxID=1250059 RepID=UPI00089BE33C|nr:SAM-dependent methyltransferase [Tenacibaculum sp. MAR_2009_124]SEB39919.1 Methyltransferase domain-containing protein [Tenacibaculum sp. MAR_2009_124]